MPIDLARVAAVGDWVRNQIGPANWFEGFFDSRAPPATPRVAAHRLTITNNYDTGRPPSWTYAELYDDGAGFACTRVPDPRRAWQGGERAGTWITNQGLLFDLARCLLLLGRHAGENCGAWGDALIEARVLGQDPLLLAFLDQFNHPEPVRGGRELQGPVASRHTGVVHGLARVGAPLLATTRLIAADLFHAFGSPEVRHLYFGAQQELREWAEQRGIEVTEETIGASKTKTAARPPTPGAAAQLSPSRAVHAGRTGRTLGAPERPAETQ